MRFFDRAERSIGADNKAKAGTDRKEVESLVAQARAALKKGELDDAESLTMRAESLGVEFSMFHLGDTPKKLRSDLNAAHKRASKRRHSESHHMRNRQSRDCGREIGRSPGRESVSRSGQQYTP